MFAELIALTTLAMAPQGPTVTFTDDTFDNADWQTSQVVFGLGAATVAAAQIQSGNPAPARRVTHTFTSGAFGVGIQSHHLMTAAVYDPAASGAIGILHFALDARNVSTVQRLNWALKQGTKIYVRGGPLTPTVWTTFTSGALGQNDFVERLSNGVHNPTSHPDFTTSGLPITFGFEAADSWHTNVLTVDYDNFRVDVDGLPATVAIRLGNPPNADVMRPVSGQGPILGTTWGPVIDHSTFLPNATLDFLAFGFSPGSITTPHGVLLCSPIVDGYGLNAGQPFLFSIPNDMNFLGATLCLQGGSGDPALSVFRLTNALDVTIGTY